MALNWVLLILFSASGFFGSEEVPEFKGGNKNLTSFITRSLIYPEYSKQNCLQGTVNISFQLNSKGRIFGSKVQKGFGTDLDKEALRIVRLTSGRWSVPGTFDTTQSIVIPINFTLKEYDCHQSSAIDIKEAIAAYQAHEDLTKAVFNFYEKKGEGTYAATDEAKISELKQQLGYDERFNDRLLKQALLKLKQGDKEGACEDFHFIRKLGSEKTKKFITDNCL
ncbi:MAG: energy transducer TonB [Pyrinomonadaceae bacterium]|nr:energy transducer TonB [Sphingobacteriaceae bacterium]